jgi:iron-sulfur cluster assembly protein
MATLDVSLRKGQPLLDALLARGAEVAHDCGGKLACVSCQVIVREGAGRLLPASEDEADLLDRAGAADPRARLACQAVGEGDFVVEIPLAAAPRNAGTLPVLLTGRAAAFLAAQLVKSPGAAAVRLGVRPSGCSGYRYAVEAAETIDADDSLFECGGVRIVVAAASLPFLQGVTVDVLEQGLGRRLDFSNPNATQTCGCGESFGT